MPRKTKTILAIETSCDETGLAILEAHGDLRTPRLKVVKNLVASQIAIHRPFGGVVPNLAKREHLKNLPILLARLTGATPAAQQRFWKKIDFITVTVGPGLEPALWTGITFAEALTKKHNKPLVGANHLEGHVYSFLLSPEFAKKSAVNRNSISHIFPAVALIVSGGHTILLRMDSWSKWQRLGETRDDAAGEAFDKVARLLDLPYPGGPEVEKLAAEYEKTNAAAQALINFPRPMLHEKNYDFSFSGLKTAVLYYVRDHAEILRTPDGKAKLAASFQSAALDVLVAKTMRAAQATKARSVILCGGVAANRALRKRLGAAVRKEKMKFFVPEFKYNLDNAAMIGAAGYMTWLRKTNYPVRANGGLEM